jgi:hypothetical protein
MDTDKYEVIGLPYLIKQIQKASIKLSDPKVKKEMSQTFYKKQMMELRDMRWSVQARLKKLDRTKPEFFPLGTIVDYNNGETRNAVVEDHDEGHCVIRCEGEVYQIKVDPRYLTLKHLRTKL